MEAGGEQTNMTRLLEHIITLFAVYLKEVTSRTGNHECFQAEGLRFLTRESFGPELQCAPAIWIFSELVKNFGITFCLHQPAGWNPHQQNVGKGEERPHKNTAQRVATYIQY